MGAPPELMVQRLRRLPLEEGVLLPLPPSDTDIKGLSIPRLVSSMRSKRQPTQSRKTQQIGREAQQASEILKELKSDLPAIDTNLVLGARVPAEVATTEPHVTQEDFTGF